MATISLAVYLRLLVTLIFVYRTQGRDTQGTSIFDRLSDTFPKMRKDFEPYAQKFTLEFVGELESICDATAEFKDFFAKLKDYINFCFKPTTSGLIDIQVEMSRKSKQLSKAMSALSVPKDRTSVYYWRLLDSLVSMEKVSIEMKKISSKEIHWNKKDKYYWHVLNWVINIALFAKEASKMKGKPIDLAPFRITSKDSDANIDFYERAANRTQGSFSLPLYLKNFPKMSKDFEPFAYKGMLDFVSDLEGKCLGTPEFKGFFAKLNDYMDGFKLLSSGSDLVSTGLHTIPTPVPVEIEDRATKLYIAISALNVTKGETSDPWKLRDALSSMGNALVEMKKNGSKQITFEQRRELTWSMVKWARAVSLFVKTASEKKGVSIDISSFEVYYNSHVFVPSKGARDGN